MHIKTHENFETESGYRWLKTAFLSVFVALIISVATTAGAVWWSGNVSTIEPGNTFQPRDQAVAPPPQDEEPDSSDEQPPATAITTDTKLTKTLNDFASGQPVDFSIYAEHIGARTRATHAADQVFRSASLYKLFVAHEIYREIDTGIITYQQAAGSGTGRSISRCLRDMIIVSDNPCGVALGNIISWSGRDKELHRLGYANTSLVSSGPTTTARDVAQLYKDVYSGKYLTPESRENFLSLLKSQQINARLPQGLPSTIEIGHKTGDIEGYVHDGGIIFGLSGDYILVVLSGPWSLPLDQVNDRFADISRQVFNHYHP